MGVFCASLIEETAIVVLPQGLEGAVSWRGLGKRRVARQLADAIMPMRIRGVCQ
jgi:hypothetical protein